MSNPIHIRVSAPAAPNPIGRRRGKPARLWGKEPVLVEVVDEPKGDGQISPASFASLQSDPFIKIEFAGGDMSDAAAASEISAVKAQLAKATAEIEKLQAQIVAEAERMADERRMHSRAGDEMARRVEAAESDAATARARLAESQSRRKPATV